ncbi:hypothetical protein Tco_0780896, partial [Tanacetum coccineum]
KDGSPRSWYTLEKHPQYKITFTVATVKKSPGYGVSDFISSWFLVKCRHIYAVSSLMDTAYRMSESVSSNVFV